MSIERIKSVLAEFDDVSFATLFGSRAKGQERPDSDWDIGIYVSDRLDKYERFRLHRQIVSALAPAIEPNVVVLNDSPAVLAHRALAGDVLLKRSPEIWVRFFVLTMSRYMDEEYWRKFFQNQPPRERVESTHGRS